jgi:hypothetical protein
VAKNSSKPAPAPVVAAATPVTVPPTNEQDDDEGGEGDDEDEVDPAAEKTAKAMALPAAVQKSGPMLFKKDGMWVSRHAVLKGPYLFLFKSETRTVPASMVNLSGPEFRVVNRGAEKMNLIDGEGRTFEFKKRSRDAADTLVAWAIALKLAHTAGATGSTPRSSGSTPRGTP